MHASKGGGVPAYVKKKKSEILQQVFQHYLHSNNLKHLFLASLYSNKKLNTTERVV